MDNPAFGSSHLSSPALVVFSQAANGLSDALRLQRPFHSQLQDAKDLHHLSLVSSYGTHLLHGFQPHLFNHHLNPAVSSASSPFGSGGAFVKPFPSNLSLPSAFQPPKCLSFGLDQGLLFGSGNNSSTAGNGSSGGGGGTGSDSFRTDSSSPACASLSPPTKDESMEGQTSEDGDRDRILSPNRSPETPGFRRIGPKKPATGHNHNCCPVCGVQIPAEELESHFSAELNRIAKSNMHSERQEIRRTFSMEIHAVQSTLQSRSSRWETFQRIRVNRQGRLRGKLRKRKFEEEAFCQSCPVCHGRLQRTQEEIAQHIEDCVRKQQNTQSMTASAPAVHHHHNHQHQQMQQEEEETVDVESYGEETSNGAINMTSQFYNNNNNSVNNNNNNNNNSNQVINNNNNNNTIIHNKIDKTTPEEHTITSLNRPAANWDNKSRMSLSINCTQINENAITRVTPTSSDQRITDVEYEMDNERDQSQERMRMSDNEEEVIVDNTDDENDCGMKRKQLQMSALQHQQLQLQHQQRLVNGIREIKKSTEEATSSVEIDSATESNNNHPPSVIRPSNDATPNSDSYVSTSETVDTPAQSKAQVLEELKARIRELEGSPHYKCFICKEKCKTFIISTICGHYHCEDCWIAVSDIEKQCPRCKITTLNIDFRKISCLN